MSKILFSPLGGSDPIRNNKDGSMLHICRMYKPDKVFLYLSKEMYENHLHDDRYCYCIRELGKLLHHSFDIQPLIVRDNLEEVQDYNYFYEDFRQCLFEIADTMKEDDELLVNISSGTPAMKSALLVLSILAEVPFKPIQISTPRKKSNITEENTTEYDPELQWECNADNESCEVVDGKSPRLQEIHPKNLVTLLKVNIIKQHLINYDYEAAVNVAKGISNSLSEEAFDYLNLAAARIRRDNHKVATLTKKTGYNPLPVKKDGDRQMAEYLLSLVIKEKKGNYDDFVRGISPIIVALLEKAISHFCNTDITDYYFVNRDGECRWDRNKLDGSQVLSILDASFNGSFNYGFIYSVQLKNILVALSDNQKLNRTAEELRKVEENVRNRAAHTMDPITAETVRRWTGFTTQEIVQKLKFMGKTAGIFSNGEIWNSYDEMNEVLIKKLEECLALE